MGRAVLAALSGSVSVVAVGAVIGIALVASTAASAPVAAATSRAAVTAPSLTASGLTLAVPGPAFAVGVAHSLSLGIARLQRYAADVQSSPVGSGSVRQPAVLTTAAMSSGLARSGYTFSAQITGFADLSTLGSTVSGTVTDASHYTLEFPASATITRYVRDGDDAFAWVGQRRLTLAAGAGAALGTISPDDFLPARLWAIGVAQWADTLKPDTTTGDYTASSATLTEKARQGGYAAQDWTLKAHLDGFGRLTGLRFAGTSFAKPFGLDLAVTYP